MVSMFITHCLRLARAEEERKRAVMEAARQREDHAKKVVEEREMRVYQVISFILSSKCK